MKITINKFRSGAATKWYPQQTSNQQPILELYEGGDVSITYDAEIGNAIPMSLYHGRMSRWDLPFPPSCAAAREWLRDLRPLIQRVHDGRKISWDGNNNTGTLSPDAARAYAEIESYISNIRDYDDTMCCRRYLRECRAHA